MNGHDIYSLFRDSYVFIYEILCQRSICMDLSDSLLVIFVLGYVRFCVGDSCRIMYLPDSVLDIPVMSCL